MGVAYGLECRLCKRTSHTTDGFCHYCGADNRKELGLTPSPKPRAVVCAAIRNKEGHVITGARHWDSVMRSQVLVFGKRPPQWLSAEQGFIDQFGVFMTREEAYTVAMAAGQVRYGPTHSKGTLYSEDLY